LDFPDSASLHPGYTAIFIELTTQDISELQGRCFSFSPAVQRCFFLCAALSTSHTRRFFFRLIRPAAESEQKTAESKFILPVI
jgi:hypothetical protein